MRVLTVVAMCASVLGFWYVALTTVFSMEFWQFVIVVALVAIQVVAVVSVVVFLCLFRHRRYDHLHCRIHQDPRHQDLDELLRKGAQGPPPAPLPRARVHSPRPRK